MPHDRVACQHCSNCSNMHFNKLCYFTFILAGAEQPNSLQEPQQAQELSSRTLAVVVAIPLVLLVVIGILVAVIVVLCARERQVKGKEETFE